MGYCPRGFPLLSPFMRQLAGGVPFCHSWGQLGIKIVWLVCGEQNYVTMADNLNVSPGTSDQMAHPNKV